MLLDLSFLEVLQVVSSSLLLFLFSFTLGSSPLATICYANQTVEGRIIGLISRSTSFYKELKQNTSTRTYLIFLTITLLVFFALVRISWPVNLSSKDLEHLEKYGRPVDGSSINSTEGENGPSVGIIAPFPSTEYSTLDDMSQKWSSGDYSCSPFGTPPRSHTFEDLGMGSQDAKFYRGLEYEPEDLAERGSDVPAQKYVKGKMMQYWTGGFVALVNHLLQIVKYWFPTLARKYIKDLNDLEKFLSHPNGRKISDYDKIVRNLARDRSDLVKNLKMVLKQLRTRFEMDMLMIDPDLTLSELGKMTGFFTIIYERYIHMLPSYDPSVQGSVAQKVDQLLHAANTKDGKLVVDGKGNNPLARNLRKALVGLSKEVNGLVKVINSPLSSKTDQAGRPIGRVLDKMYKCVKKELKESIGNRPMDKWDNFDSTKKTYIRLAKVMRDEEASCRSIGYLMLESLGKPYENLPKFLKRTGWSVGGLLTQKAKKLEQLIAKRAEEFYNDPEYSNYLAMYHLESYFWTFYSDSTIDVDELFNGKVVKALQTHSYVSVEHYFAQGQYAELSLPYSFKVPYAVFVKRYSHAKQYQESHTGLNNLVEYMETATPFNGLIPYTFGISSDMQGLLHTSATEITLRVVNGKIEICPTMDIGFYPLSVASNIEVLFVTIYGNVRYFFENLGSLVGSVWYISVISGVFGVLKVLNFISLRCVANDKNLSDGMDVKSLHYRVSAYYFLRYFNFTDASFRSFFMVGLSQLTTWKELMILKNAVIYFRFDPSGLTNSFGKFFLTGLFLVPLAFGTFFYVTILGSVLTYSVLQRYGRQGLLLRDFLRFHKAKLSLMNEYYTSLYYESTLNVHRTPWRTQSINEMYLQSIQEQSVRKGRYDDMIPYNEYKDKNFLKSTGVWSDLKPDPQGQKRAFYRNIYSPGKTQGFASALTWDLVKMILEVALIYFISKNGGTTNGINQSFSNAQVVKNIPPPLGMLIYRTGSSLYGLSNGLAHVLTATFATFLYYQCWVGQHLPL